MNYPVRRSALTEFCEKRGIPDKLRDAFAAYARAVYADRFMLRGDTDTVRLMINRLTEEQMEQVWNQFLSDLRKILPTTQ
jgi:hypothetical protein